MSSNVSFDKPMLGGCCVCLDERGWTENPLVYCDGQGCSIAVHQACYGIETVPSGPWYCGRCEVYQSSSMKLQCILCPHQDGAMKRTDTEQWAHVVCALYIPEVEFGNVSSMEPIVLKKIPEERYSKKCYICDENNLHMKSFGACMSCAKSGCKLSFHVTCAQMSGLLCEESGGSNTTKYCGYCSQHFSKHKKVSSYKNLSCSKVYNLPSSCESSEKISLERKKDTLPLDVLKTANSEANIVCNIQSSETKNSRLPNNASNDSQKVAPLVIGDITLNPKSDSGSLAEQCTLHPLVNETEMVVQECNAKPQGSFHKEETSKKKRKNVKSSGDVGAKKTIKIKKVKPTLSHKPHKNEQETCTNVSSILQDAGYAIAPKHSVVSLSSFGDKSLEPSDPLDVGSTVPTPTSQNNPHDGLTSIELLIEQQANDVMQFFQEFGTPSHVAPLLQTLRNIREENAQLETSVEKMTHRRDQLLAIKARLSVPLKSSQYGSRNETRSDSSGAEFIPFNTSNQQQYTVSYPYYTNNK